MYRLVRTSGDSHVWEQTPAAVPAWRRSSLHLDSTIEIALYETGPTDPEAPAIVLVHGLGHWTQASWNRVAVQLEGTHRIVAFDLPGFGRSSRPDTRYDIRFFSAALAAVVNAASLRSFALAGHSLGGLIAADFASMHIDDVDLLMLIDPAGFLRTPSLLVRILASRPVSNLFTIKPSRGFVRAQLERSVYDKRALEPGVVDEAYAFAQDPLLRRAFARVYSDSLSSFVDLPALHARFGRYKGPASIFWGLNDKYIPVRALAGARKVYPNADVTVIEHCGHCPPIEFPELVAQRLAAYGANRTGASVDGRSYR